MQSLLSDGMCRRGRGWLRMRPFGFLLIVNTYPEDGGGLLSPGSWRYATSMSWKKPQP